jgi:quinol monooxygenase YgiN
MSYAVVVSFLIKPGAFDTFMPLMLSNAATSKSVEEGCTQFDVATDTARPNEVFLYEIYKNRDAFDAHLNSQHFKTFDRAVAGMIASKDVRTYSQIVQ